MGRRPPSADDDISLFPFLSIVACVIGVLTMMIATLALQQTNTDDVAKVEEYENLQKKIDEQDERIDELTSKIKVSSESVLHYRERAEELSLNMDELKKLEEEMRKIEEEIKKQQQIKVVIPEANPKERETATQMQAEYEAIQEQLAQLEKDLSKRESVPKEGKVSILPQGSGLTFTPHFVECAAGATVLHTQQPTKSIRTAETANDKDFLALLNKVANGRDDSIIFLVRSDGLGTYRTLRDICNRSSIRNGKIPVVGKGRIDLSVFAKRANKATQ